MSVYSEVGRATVFKLFFPRVPDSAPGVETPPAAAAPRGVEHILVVEDDDAVRQVLRRGLEQHGYQVVVSSGSREAIDLCRRPDLRFDLLVTDVVMPEMSGAELAALVAPMRPRMKVLFVSGFMDDAVERHGISIDQAHLLQKPFSSQALARKVRQVLDSG